MALKQLATHCNFGSFLEQALRDRLVVGLRDEALIRRLLLEKSLTFDSACNIVQEAEMVQKQANVIVNPSGINRCVHGVAAKWNAQHSHKGKKKPNDSTHQKVGHNSNSNQRKPTQYPSPGTNRCNKCNRQHSSKDVCPAIKWVCFKCNKLGHISSVCRTGRVSLIEAELTCNNLSRNEPSKAINCESPLLETVCVDDQHINFEIDSGATLTLMPFFMYRKFLDISLLNHIMLN